MPFNVLLLPLLGGYVFLILCYRSRYRIRHHSGQQILFHSAVAGTVFLLLAFVLVRAIAQLSPGIEARWQTLVPFDWSGTSAVAFLLGCLLWWPSNWFFSRDQEITHAVERSNDFLEGLLHRALHDAERISVTTKNDKVYVGFVTGTYDPSFDREHISILPLFSGYRRAEDRRVEFVTEYLSVYRTFLPGIDVADDPDRASRFQIVLPVDQVCSANLFDPQAYAMFEGEAGLMEDANPGRA